MRWSECTTVKFVRLYKDHECLWDSSNVNYRNKHMRDAAYNKIVEEMAIEGFGVSEAKQKVKNLQSTYSQELKKIEEKSKKSSADGGEAYVPSLKWFTIMDSILRNAKQKSVPKCKSEPCDVLLTEVKTEELDEVPRIIPCEVSIEDIEEEYPLKLLKRPKTNEDTNIKEAFQFMKTMTEMVSNRDEYTVYGEHIANKLRNSRRSKLEIAIAQHYIDEVCFKLTMGEYFHQSFGANLNSLLSESSSVQNNHS